MKNCITRLQSGSAGLYSCQSVLEKNACDIITLGWVIKGLPQIELQSIFAHSPTPVYSRSADRLIRIIDAIRVLHQTILHCHCNSIPGIVQKLRAKTMEVEDLVTREHIDHLLRQKEKTRLITEY